MSKLVRNVHAYTFWLLRFYVIAYTTLNKVLAVFINNICGFVKECSLVWLEWQEG